MQLGRDIEKYTEDYLKDDFEYKMSFYRKKMLLEILNKYNPKTIVDIGPSYNYLFNDYTDFEHYTIVEPSKVICQNIKKIDNVTVLNDFLENVVTEIKPSDFIIASGLIHEIVNPNLFLQSIKKIATKNSTIHISAPNSNSFHLLFAYESGLIKQVGELTEYSKKMQRCATYNMESLSELVTNNGFEIIEKGPFFIKPFNQTKMVKAIETNILDDNLLEGLYKMSKYMPEYSAEIWINAKIK